MTGCVVCGVELVQPPDAKGVRAANNAAGSSALRKPSVYSESSTSATMAADASAETACLEIFS